MDDVKLLSKRVEELEQREKFLIGTLARIVNVQEEEMFKELYATHSDEHTFNTCGLTVAIVIARSAIEKYNK